MLEENCWMFAFRLQNLPYWRESGCRCTQPKACCTQTSAPLSWDSGTGTQYLFLKPDIVGIVMRYERDIGGIYNQQYPTINNIRFGSNSGYNYTQISNKEFHDWWLDSRVAYLDKLIFTVGWYLNILKCLLLLNNGLAMASGEFEHHADQTSWGRIDSSAPGRLPSLRV